MKALKLLKTFFDDQGWTIWPFQKEVWKSYAKGESGLISVSTGSGKTYAAFLGPLAEIHETNAKGLKVLYITPLRALARDLEFALRAPIAHLQWPYRVETRTGDTPQSVRLKQKKEPPEILLTTPESLSLMLTDATSIQHLRSLYCVIVDEWHELLGTKRGVMLELALARLHEMNPQLKIWGLSATLGNLEEAAQTLCGAFKIPKLISCLMPREVIIETILPNSIEELPWSGMLGMRMLSYVIAKLDPAVSTLIFTNTRSQAEKWFQAIIQERPEWQSITALHHSSIEQEDRQIVERGIKNREIKFAVSTSSLDLGVDFSPVEKVVQIGSPKSLARLMQRAGRASHRPLTPCHISLVPTHALELAEISALRMGLEKGVCESKEPLEKCFDVLLQHIETTACGEGFYAENLYQEIQKTHAYRHLTYEEFSWCLNFLVKGGQSLQRYPEFHKLVCEEKRYRMINRQFIQRHKLNIGTIASRPLVHLKFASGKKIGLIEEDFISRLSKGNTFFFAGKMLELIGFQDLDAYVRISKQVATTTPSWLGGYLPYSEPLSYFLRLSLMEKKNHYPESILLQQACAVQKKYSHLPSFEEILIEVIQRKEGHHLFVYPFEGKVVHEGMAAILVLRLSRQQKGSYVTAANDYGFEIWSRHPFPTISKTLFSSHALAEDLADSLNVIEMAKGRFRDIARISGLIFSGYPHKHKTSRQIQMGSSVLFDVFRQYDPENLLYLQATEEVLNQQLNYARLLKTFKRVYESRLIIKETKRLTPFALPLFVEKESASLDMESLQEKIERIKEEWQKK